MVDFLYTKLFPQLENNAKGAETGNASDFLNRRLYYALRKQILSGALPAHYRLPSSRNLAAKLGVSRNTVLYAYEQLLAEGFVITKHGSGTYVSDIFIHMPNTGNNQGQLNSDTDEPPYTPIRPLSTRGKNLLHHAGATNYQWGPFVSGVPDVSVFPHRLWARLLGKVWRQNPNPSLLTYATHGGYKPLREAIATHLRIVRAANCDADQIIITSGIHQALDLTARMLADPGEAVWMEEPSYWGVKSVMTMAGLQIIPVPVDNEGLAPNIHEPYQNPRLIFATPSHQYPLGTVMSLARRQLLLELAQKHDAWIIEDDYDSEFRFDGRPLASLQGLDSHERVIYLGTFSKTLFPGLRLGYMIVPKSLANAFAKGLSELFREGQMAQQVVLAEFFNKGHYSTHVRRMRQIYASRREALSCAVKDHFGEGISMSNQEAGLHMVLHFNDDVDDKAITAAAYEKNLVTRPLSSYYLGHTKPKKGLLLGYACVPEEVITSSFATLAAIIKQHIK